MTDASNNPEQNPYAPPPAPAAGTPPVAPVAGAPAVPPVPQAPFAEPLGYQPPPAPPAAASQYAPQQPPVAPAGYQPPTGYPAQAPVPAGGKKPMSQQASSIIAIVAGAVSIFIFPWIAGVIGIGMGVQTLRLDAVDRRAGRPTSGVFTTLAVLGIVLGALGIIAKLVLDIIF